MASTSHAHRTTAHQPRLAVFAGVSAAWVFVLVTLGAFTTSIGAGMAFPDWPLSNGSVNPTGWLEDAAKFAEHSHRLSGATMGLLAIGLAVWLHLREERAWLRRLAWWALAIVIVQGVLGGTRVLLDRIAVPGFEMSLGQMLRIPHGVLAQLYVCLLIAIAVSCTRGWLTRSVPVGAAVRRAGLVCTALMLVQLVVAATMRHNAAGLAIPVFPQSTIDGHWLPAAWDFRVALQFSHRVLAAVLAVGLSVFAWCIRRDSGASLAMRAGASALISLMVLQILLGAEIIRTLRHSDVTTGHVLVGALTLATTFWLTWIAHRDAIEPREIA
ncbi:MAG: Heme synthase [Verrucomicrobiota bacterium]|jgi:cytochrome c oxidase assembly protein subunit 15